jgi:thiosulfate dehydrogenase [quinone] large subunit
LERRKRPAEKFETRRPSARLQIKRPSFSNCAGAAVKMQSHNMNDPNEDKNSGCGCDQTLAFLVLRGWLAIRAILAGIEKYGAYTTKQKPLVDPVTGMEDPSGAMIDVKVKFYSLTNYAGVPAPLKDKFANEPLLPPVALTTFDHLLGPLLIATGVMLLLGLGTRLSLFVQGLVYIALTAGLILIKQDDGISWLGIHVALIALALMLAKHNKFALLKKW